MRTSGAASVNLDGNAAAQSVKRQRLDGRMYGSDSEVTVEVNGNDEVPSRKMASIKKESSIGKRTSRSSASDHNSVGGEEECGIGEEDEVNFDGIPSSSTMPITRNYVTEVCEIKAAMRSVYDHVNMGRLNKNFKESMLRKLKVTADFPESVYEYDLTEFIPIPLREKHSFQVDRHLRAAIQKDQQEKRTRYVIEAAADEILSKLHRPDPVALRLACGQLTKQISLARGWTENLPNSDDVYRMVIDMDVDELLGMARLLSARRPALMRRVFKNGTVGQLKSDFLVSTLKQLKVSHYHPSDINKMTIKWVIPMELVAIHSAVDTICARIKLAVEVAQLNNRIEYFIAYNANELLTMRLRNTLYSNELKIKKMLYEVVAINEWKTIIPSISAIIARVDGMPTATLKSLCSTDSSTRGTEKAAAEGSSSTSEQNDAPKSDDPQKCDLMIIWDEAVKYVLV